MDPFSLLIVLALVGLGIFVYHKATTSGRRKKEAQEAALWLAGVTPVVTSPDTEPSVLRHYLTMNNPHDSGFYARLEMFRLLAANPALSPELQGAAINRVTQGESAVHLDKTLRKMRGANVGGFAGVSVPL